MSESYLLTKGPTYNGIGIGDTVWYMSGNKVCKTEIYSLLFYKGTENIPAVRFSFGPGIASVSSEIIFKTKHELLDSL